MFKVLTEDATYTLTSMHQTPHFDKYLSILINYKLTIKNMNHFPHQKKAKILRSSLAKVLKLETASNYELYI